MTGRVSMSGTRDCAVRRGFTEVFALGGIPVRVQEGSRRVAGEETVGGWGSGLVREASVGETGGAGDALSPVWRCDDRSPDIPCGEIGGRW